MCKFGKRILIVEDTPSVAILLSATLKRDGYNVNVCETVEAALSAVQASTKGNVPYDLVLVDINLPDASGDTLVQTLSKTTSIPSIAVSADGSDATRERALNAGAAIFLEKPFPINELRDAIKEYSDQKETKHYGFAADDLEAEKQKMMETYKEYLANSASELESTTTYKRLSSLLHQLKGSAQLYGYEELSELSASLSERLITQGSRAAGDIRRTLRQELYVFSSRS